MSTMKSFFLNAGVGEDIVILETVLLRSCEKGLFKDYFITYIPEGGSTRIDISENVSLEMMKTLISEFPDGHRMMETLTENIDQSDYNWKDVMMKADYQGS